MCHRTYNGIGTLKTQFIIIIFIIIIIIIIIRITITITITIYIIIIIIIIITSNIFARNIISTAFMLYNDFMYATCLLAKDRGTTGSVI